MKDFVEEHESSEENNNFKESDGDWENWDDGD